MHRLKSFLAVSSMAIGGFAFTARGADPAPGDTAAQNTGTQIRTDVNNTANQVNSDLNRGDVNAKAPDADDIRKTVAKVTEDAVTKGDFHKLSKNFVDADYDRIKTYKSDDNFAKLNGRIDQFNKDWKAKYNENFGFTSARNDVLNDSFAQITQGEIGEARTAGGKEVPSADPQNVKGGTAADLQKSGVNQPDANSNKTFGGETKREAGRNIASFTIKGSTMATAKAEMQKDLAIPMIHELPDTWKIDIPDNIDGQKLQDNLLKHLTMVDEDRANWPADKNEAYRAVTRHVMMAVMESGM